MGSPEGYAQADEAIKEAAKRGHWVLLKNVHLAPQWLSKLEKALHLQVHAQYVAKAHAQYVARAHAASNSHAIVCADVLAKAKAPDEQRAGPHAGASDQPMVPPEVRATRAGGRAADLPGRQEKAAL